MFLIWKRFREAIPEVTEQEIESELGGEKSKELRREVIPPLEEDKANELWDEVHHLKEQDGSLLNSAPFSEIHLSNSLELEQIPTPKESMIGDEDDCSQANILATLPSYIGKTENGTKILRIPLFEHIIPKASETRSLQAILSAPITATLPLMDFLKVKPKLWAQVSKLLRHRGYFKNGHVNQEQGKIPVPESHIQKVSLNKLNNVGKYKVDKGNSMLPVQVNKVKTLAILDTGARISIATREMWIKWGKLSLRKTRMEL